LCAELELCLGCMGGVGVWVRLVCGMVLGIGFSTAPQLHMGTLVRLVCGRGTRGVVGVDRVCCCSVWWHRS
jgi:hypothetical protein